MALLRGTLPAMACTLLLMLVWAGQAHAFVYWNQSAGATIMRANLDGSGINSNFLFQPGGNISRIAIDGGHIYWADRGAGTIGRANLDGSGADPGFITAAGNPVSVGGSAIEGVAVDAGHIYWTVGSDNGTNGSIGRANIDGTDANRTFIPNVTTIEVAVDASHIYWTGFSRIARANLDGSGVNTDFVDASTGEFAPLLGLAVGPTDLYWTNVSTDRVGRASLDGTAVDPSFIAPGGSNPVLQGVAVDAGHVYWVDTSGLGRIGRADLDGTGVDPAFIANNSQPGGIAVDDPGVRPTSVSVSCTPAMVAVDNASTCTATVTDTAAGAASSPLGEVMFASSNGSEGTFPSSSHCTLGTGAPGTSACAVTFVPHDFFDTVPRTDVISATYVPDDNVHAPSASGAAGSASIGVLAADTTPPVTAIALSPAAPNGHNGWYVSAVHATVSATDAANTVVATRCVLDPAVPPASYDAIPTGCAYTGSGADVTGDGQHVIYAASIDTAGNKATPVSRSFKIDATAPQTAITSGPPAASTDTTPSFSFTSSEAGSTFQCRIDSGAFTTCSSPFTTAVGGGAHTFAVRATDAAGNTDATPATTSFRVCSGPLGGLGVLLNGLLPNTGLLCT